MRRTRSLAPDPALEDERTRGILEDNWCAIALARQMRLGASRGINDPSRGGDRSHMAVTRPLRSPTHRPRPGAPWNSVTA